MKFKRNPSGRGGYFHGKRFSIAYRGFHARPFIRGSGIRAGSTMLYCVGPLALFVRAASRDAGSGS